MIGIWNKGKRTKIIGNRFKGVDIGIKDEGEDTIAKGNEFVATGGRVKRWYEKWWGILILGIIASAVVTAAFYFLN